MEEKIFVNGYVTQDIPETAPDYILGKASIKVTDFRKWLDENEKYAVRGYLNIVTKRSKEKQVRYSELDLYSYKQAQEESSLPPDVVAELKAARENEIMARKARDTEVIMSDTPF